MKREDCPFCGCPDSKPSGVAAYPKVGIKPFKDSKIVECDECKGQYTDIVPTESSFESMYTKDYGKQKQGLVRFQRAFGDDVEFGEDTPVLEVGGGTVGVRAICERYWNVDLRGCADFQYPFESMPDEDVTKCREEGVRAIVTCDCIEHVLYPDEFFAMAARILPPGGRMYMQSGECKETDKVYPRNDRQAAHINCPSENSIRIMCGDEFDWVSGDCVGEWGWVFARTGD